jgi:hypothetical protein
MIRARNISPTHFSHALDFAGRLSDRAALREFRFHAAIRSFVAALGLLVGEARRNSEAANAACRKTSEKRFRRCRHIRHRLMKAAPDRVMISP